MPRMVWAEIGDNGRAIRILKNLKSSIGRDRVAYILRERAVTEIRRQIWDRDKHRCTHCGALVSWYAMQMHERTWRGRGGEISLDNGTTLCEDDHSNSEVAGHGKRKPQWSA